MSATQFRRWMDYAQAEPFGEERADLRSAIVAMTVANSAGGKTKVGDFMPQFNKPKPKRQSWQAMKAILRQAGSAINQAAAARSKARG